MVLDYLESSAMIANVLSLVSLGIIGVIIRNIVKAFGELRVEHKVSMNNVQFLHR